MIYSYSIQEWEIQYNSEIGEMIRKKWDVLGREQGAGGFLLKITKEPKRKS